MSYPSKGLLLAWLVVTASCAGPARTGPPEDTSRLPRDFEFTISGGQEDLKNHYRSVVMVTGERGLCSGVLMAPRLVLTAAHCLCLPVKNPSEALRVDSSDCVKNVIVVTHSYGVRAGTRPPEVESNARFYKGVAFAHPSFKALIQPGGVASLEGDIAAVRLDAPVEGMKIDNRLPPVEVTVDEVLTMVGFGETGLAQRDMGRRRAGQNIVTSVLLESGGNGVFAFRGLGAHSKSGDSGGPCFREDKKGERWVMGINSGHANAGTISLFTSTFHYRGWIAEQIRKAQTD